MTYLCGLVEFDNNSGMLSMSLNFCYVFALSRIFVVSECNAICLIDYAEAEDCRSII
jgi:hypothetical protein